MKLHWTFLPALVAAGVSVPFIYNGLKSDAPSPTRPNDDKKIERKADDPPPKKQDEPKPVVKEQPAAQPNPSGDFRLPDDAGGRLVLRIVSPPQTLSEPRRSAPLERSAPRAIESPSVPLPTQVISLPRLPAILSKTTQPEVVSPESYLALHELIGVLPQVLVFPALDRVRVPGTDVNAPIALPRVAQPLADRAATTDPTLDIAKNAVLSAPLPQRTTPAPFQRLTLPDPFEHYDAVRGLAAPPDDTLPDANVKPPRK